MRPAAPKPLRIPWSRNQLGQPQKAGDPDLPRGLACNCHCPNCEDQLIHRNGSIMRGHFAHYNKQPTQTCFESSIHLAYKYAFVEAAGKTFTLPTTPEPSAMGTEPWRMNPQITVANVQIEAPILLPDGKRRVADVLLTCEDGRRIAVEVAVTNSKEPEYASQMESVGILAIEHLATVTNPNQEIPSAQQILVEATWLWEPHSGPLRESMKARQQRDRFLFAETQLASLNKATDKAASTAKSHPKDAHELLIGIAARVVELTAHDPVQQSTLSELRNRAGKGLAITHTRAHETEAHPFRELVNALVPTPSAQIRPIAQDKFGSWLRRDTREILNRRARQVAQLGFYQTDKRATLFTARTGSWQTYVDFDSTDVMRIWEVDCEPAIYAFPENPLEHRELLLAALSDKLTQAGVPHRRFFLDSHQGPCWACQLINASNADLHQWLEAHSYHHDDDNSGLTTAIQDDLADMFYRFPRNEDTSRHCRRSKGP